MSGFTARPQSIAHHTRVTRMRPSTTPASTTSATSVPKQLWRAMPLAKPGAAGLPHRLSRAAASSTRSSREPGASIRRRKRYGSWPAARASSSMKPSMKKALNEWPTERQKPTGMRALIGVYSTRRLGMRYGVSWAPSLANRSATVLLPTSAAVVFAIVLRDRRGSHAGCPPRIDSSWCGVIGCDSEWSDSAVAPPFAHRAAQERGRRRAEEALPACRSRATRSAGPAGRLASRSAPPGPRSRRAAGGRSRRPRRWCGPGRRRWRCRPRRPPPPGSPSAPGTAPTPRRCRRAARPRSSAAPSARGPGTARGTPPRWSSTSGSRSASSASPSPRTSTPRSR